jgi:hypothetical protein
MIFDSLFNVNLPSFILKVMRVLISYDVYFEISVTSATPAPILAIILAPHVSHPSLDTDSLFL